MGGRNKGGRKQKEKGEKRKEGEQTPPPKPYQQDGAFWEMRASELWRVRRKLGEVYGE